MMNEADNKKKILLIDDFNLFRMFLADGLRQKPEFVVSEASTAEEALKQVEQIRPDVIILNVSMRYCSGIAMMRSIHRRFADIGVLAFSYLHHDHLYAERAIYAGASGYISVDESSAGLLEAIATIAGGGTYLNQHLHKKISLMASGRGQDKESPLERLSHREFEVFCLIGHGHVTKRIADMLKVSVKTIETYRERIREKLNLADGGDLLYHSTSFIREQSMPCLSEDGDSV